VGAAGAGLSLTLGIFVEPWPRRDICTPSKARYSKETGFTGWQAKESLCIERIQFYEVRADLNAVD